MIRNRPEDIEARRAAHPGWQESGGTPETNAVGGLLLGLLIIGIPVMCILASCVAFGP